MKLTLLSATLALAVPGAASAHIVFAEPEAAAGAYYAGFLRVGHACGTSPTRSIRVQIPADVISAKPQPKQGWTLKIEHEALASPQKGEGGATITQRVSAITWTGELPADQFDEFGILFKLPERAGPLYFPTRQSCASGTVDWATVPASPEAWMSTSNPAPMVMVHGKPQEEHHMH